MDRAALEPSEVCSDSWRHFDIDKGEKHSSTRADKQNLNLRNPTRGSLATFWILRVWRGHSGFALRNHLQSPGLRAWGKVMEDSAMSVARTTSEKLRLVVSADEGEQAH